MDSSSSGSDVAILPCPSLRSNSSPLTIGLRGAMAFGFNQKLSRVRKEQGTHRRSGLLGSTGFGRLIGLGLGHGKDEREWKIVGICAFVQSNGANKLCTYIEMARGMLIYYVHGFALSPSGVNKTSKQAKRCSHSLSGQTYHNIECKDDERDADGEVEESVRVVVVIAT